jgi:hypothetical protein
MLPNLDDLIGGDQVYGRVLLGIDDEKQKQ